MSKWFSGDVTANSIKIHYHRTGGDKPSLVLSHGFTDNGLCWTRLAQDLEGEYDIVMYDARGHGLSAAPAEGYSDANRAADLAGLIEGLGLEKPRLIGHSMGAATTATTAANYPGLVRCAILEDPPWRAKVPTPEELAAHIENRRAGLVERKAMTREELIASGHAKHPAWAEIVLGPWADAKFQASFNILKRISSLRAPWQELVPKITCPILLITGDPEREAIVTPEVAQEAAGLWHRGKTVHISGAGHNIRREQYGKYLEAISASLAEME